MKKMVTIGMLCSALFMLSACSGPTVDNSKSTVVKPTVDSSKGTNPTVVKPTVDSSKGLNPTSEEAKKGYLEGCNPSNDTKLASFCECTYDAIASKYGNGLVDLATKIASDGGTNELTAITESCRDLLLK